MVALRLLFNFTCSSFDDKPFSSSMSSLSNSSGGISYCKKEGISLIQHENVTKNPSYEFNLYQVMCCRNVFLYCKNCICLSYFLYYLYYVLHFLLHLSCISTFFIFFFYSYYLTLEKNTSITLLACKYSHYIRNNYICVLPCL
jgi:hypothetical protein